jgi:broad specificity phosphatase PhoE
MVKSIIMKLKNKYFLLRHGQALSNIENVISCWPEKKEFPLTEEGRVQIRESAEKLSDKKIDMIFSSDLLRTKQTAEIVAEKLGSEIKYDERLREYNVGVYNSKSIFEYFKVFNSQLERFHKKAKEGEDYNDIKKRMRSFIEEKEKEFGNKNILVVSHQIPIIILLGVVNELSDEEITKEYLEVDRIKNGEIVEV